MASRHKRRPERHQPFVVAVLGIDGSGKSTLSRRLSLDLSLDASTCLIGDSLELFADGAPRAAQPLLKEKLRRWVSAQAKDAKSLARYKIPKLTELLLRDALLGEAKRWYGPDLIFMDGSPILNMTAWSILYRSELMSTEFCARAMAILAGTGSTKDPLFREFPELRVMKRLGLTRLSLPDAVIFLDVPPAVSMERIRSRGEKMQVHETEEKLGRLREAYLLVVEATGESPGSAHIRAGWRPGPGHRLSNDARREVESHSRRQREETGNEHDHRRDRDHRLRVDQRLEQGGTYRSPSSPTMVSTICTCTSSTATPRPRARARSLLAEGRRLLISAGGSGTFNAVLEGCCDSRVPLGEIRLGFLRKGSADLLGKVLGMPDEIEAAVAVFAESIRAGHVMPCDVLSARERNRRNGPQAFCGLWRRGDFRPHSPFHGEPFHEVVQGRAQPGLRGSGTLHNGHDAGLAREDVEGPLRPA